MAHVHRSSASAAHHGKAERADRRQQQRDEEAVTEDVAAKDTPAIAGRFHQLTDDMMAKENRRHIRKAFKKSSEVIIYIIFLVIFTVSTLYFRHPVFAFYHNDFMKDLFIMEEFPDPKILKTFYDVATIEEMWEYIEGPFVEGLQYGDGFIYGYNRLMGFARIRQVRMKEDSCAVLEEYKNLFTYCIDSWDEDKEEKGPFAGGLPGQAWTYSTDELSTAAFGRINRYGSIGFVQHLRGESNDTALVAELKDNNWVDHQTSAVFLELATYNANINIWLYARMMFEQLPSGGLVPSHTFSAMQLNNYETESLNGRVQLALDIIVYTFVVFYIGQESWELKREGLEGYFTDGWNYLDIINLSIFLVSLATRIAVNFKFGELTTEISDEHFYDFGYIAWLSQTQFNLSSVNAFLLWFKVFKYLNFAKSSLIIAKTIQKGILELIVFFVMICFLVIGFAQAGVLAFGTDVWGYREFRYSMYSLLRALLGDFDFEALYYSNRVMGPLFFSSFTVLFIFILLNVFLAIVNESYETICEEYEQKELQENYFATVWHHHARKHPDSKVVKFIKRRMENIENFQKGFSEGKADLNNDGVVDRNEFSKLAKENKIDESLFDDADKNHDGVLDSMEQRELMAALGAEKQELIVLQETMAEDPGAFAEDSNAIEMSEAVGRVGASADWQAKIEADMSSLHRKLDLLVVKLDKLGA